MISAPSMKTLVLLLTMAVPPEVKVMQCPGFMVSIMVP